MGRTEFIGIQYTLKDGSKEFVESVPGVFKDSVEEFFNKRLNMTENQLLADRVLIKPIVETQTASGIIIPETAKERPMMGEVVLVGPGTKDIEMVVKPNDIVLFGKYSGIEVTLEKEKLLLMKQEEIFMITKKKEN